MTLSETLYEAPTYAKSLAKKVTADYQEHGARLTLWNYYSVLLRETKTQVDKYVEDPAEDPCAEQAAAGQEAEDDQPSLTGLAKHVTGRVGRNVQARVMDLKYPIVKRTSELLHIDLIQYSELVLDQKAKLLDPRLEQLQGKLAKLQSRVADTKESVRSTVQQRRSQMKEGVKSTVAEAKVRLHVLKRSSEAMSQLSLQYVRSTTVAAVPGDVLALAGHYYSTLHAALLKQQKEQEEPEDNGYAELDSHLVDLAEALWGVLVCWRKDDKVVGEELECKEEGKEEVQHYAEEVDADEFLRQAESPSL